MPNRGCEFGIQHLERDVAAVTPVARQIDRRHPAATDLSLDDVTVGKSCRQTVRR